MEEGTKIFLILIAIVIIIIAAIMIIRANEKYDEKTIKCIAEKSQVVVSPTCSWCAKQKQDLGEYVDYFEFIDISENPEILEQYSITGTPTWIIEGKVYPEYRTIEELIQITGC